MDRVCVNRYQVCLRVVWCISRGCPVWVHSVPRVLNRACPMRVPCVYRMRSTFVMCVCPVCRVCVPYVSRVSCVCSVRLVCVSYTYMCPVCLTVCFPCVCPVCVPYVFCVCPVFVPFVPFVSRMCSVCVPFLSRVSRLCSSSDADTCSVHDYAGFFQVADNDELRDHCTCLLVQGINKVNALPIMVSQSRVLQRCVHLYHGTGMVLFVFVD